MDETAHIHLVSDSTGETTQTVARACLAQFEGIQVLEHFWPLVRSEDHLERVIAGITENPGPVLYTLVSGWARRRLQNACVRLNIPCISVLDPIIEAFGNHFDRKTVNRPGRQHALDSEYFGRIDALQYVMAHDDGQDAGDLVHADLVLVGVSRTSKTPTSIYLANHYGLKTANVPFILGIPLPESLFRLGDTLIVGLTASADRLVQIRRNRLLMLKTDSGHGYADLDTVRQEINEARRVFASNAWPVIDVTRRAIEETASTVYQIYRRHRGDDGPAND